MEVTIALIKDLREKTGAGMGDCKAALTESQGDMQKAIEYLRKKGAAMASKRADKIAKEGAIKSSIREDKKTGIIIEINCETDFVSKGDGFQNFAQSIADAALVSGTDDTARILDSKTKDNLSVQETIDGMMGSVGEKIEFKRAKLIKAEDGFVSSYIHFGSKVGAIIGMKGAYTKEAGDIGHKIAMQAVAMNPISVKREEISAETIEKEKEIYREQSKNEKKPDQIIEKIVGNKIEKFFQENCLVEQEYIQDATKSINDLLKEYSKKAGSELDVKSMVRFQLG